jgi:hypothetical protein
MELNYGNIFLLLMLESVILNIFAGVKISRSRSMRGALPFI